LLNVKLIKTGKWKENCFVIHNSINAGLIIDPGQNSDEIIAHIKKNKISVKAILNTHAHYDHVGAVQILKKTFLIPFYLHSKDSRLLKSVNLYISIFEGEKIISVPDVDHYFDKNKNPLIFNEISVKIIETPGHTPGSVCFQVEGCLFSGDTLFEKEIGRVDLPGGNQAELTQSLIELSKLPPELKLYPGHGNPTTMKQVISKNLKLRDLI